MFQDTRESKRTYDQARGQYRLALRLLQDSGVKDSARVLDVGAGMGEFASTLKKRGFNVTCVDSFKRCYDSLKKQGFASHLVDLEQERLPFDDESFDLVISLEVIEHIWNTDHYVTEMRRVLKPGGFLICTTPNYNNWRYRLYTVLGKFERFTYRSRHKKFYTTISFPRELGQYFVLKEILGFGWIPKTGIQFAHTYFMNLLAVHMGVLCKKP